MKKYNQNNNIISRINKTKIKILNNNSNPFELNLKSYVLGINEEFKLRPKMNTKATLEWISDNEQIATVDDKGVITPLSLGTCNIICKKGTKEASCKLTIEDIEDIAKLKLSACIYSIKVKENQPIMYSPDIENPQLSIDGDVGINNNNMIFNGTQSITTNGVADTYGSKITQRIYIKFKIDTPPSADETYSLIRLYNRMSGSPIPMDVCVNENGNLIYQGDVSDFTIPFNEWATVILKIGNDNGWKGYITYGDNTLVTGKGFWITDISIGCNNFKGEIEHVVCCYMNKITAFNDDGYAYIDKFIIDNEFIHSAASIHNNRTRTIEQDISLPLQMNWNLIDEDSLNNLSFLDDFYYDLEELDAYGYVTKVYKNALKYGQQTIEIDNDYDVPQRWDKHFRLRDNFSKNYIDAKDLSICTLDETIINNNNGVPTYFHISPKIIEGRVGDYRLIQPTFFPDRNYKDPRCEWKSSDESIATIDADGLIICKSIGECVIRAIPFANPSISATATIIVKEAIDESKFPIIDIEKYNIIPNTEDEETCIANVQNITKAFNEYKELGYEGMVLPTNTYNVKLQTSPNTLQSITIPPHFIINLNNSIINQIGGDTIPDTYVFDINGADYSCVKNGTIYGDKYTHNYGIRLNNDCLDDLSNSIFEIGCIDHRDGVTLVEKSTLDGTVGVRTKDYITEFYTDEFKIIPLWNTTVNTVDGGRVIVYWYDDEGNYISYDDKAYASKYIPPEGATKIKLVIRSEQRLDPVLSLTNNNLSGAHPTYEFGAAFIIKNSFNFELKNITAKKFQGDCITTEGYSGISNFSKVNDLRIIDCTLEDARRQGISFVATGENYLIKNNNIGWIGGVDPQCGIDFEAYGRNEKFLFDECNFYDNRKWDMVDCFSGQIEVRNCVFNGAIGLGQTSYNWYVHDNQFIYDDKYIDSADYKIARYKIHNSTGVRLPVSNPSDKYYYSIAINNNVDGKSVQRGILSAYGAKNSFTQNNVIYNGTIYTPSSMNDKMYNCKACSIETDTIIDNIMLDGSYKTDGFISFYITNNSQIINSVLKNIQLSSGVINNCNIEINGYTLGYASKKLLIKDSNIVNISDKNGGIIFGSGAGVATIDNCDIIVNRAFGGALYPSDIAYKNCRFTFNDNGNSNQLNWIGYGYGENATSVYFENCEFTCGENYPIKLNCKYHYGCTANGGFILDEVIPSTNFTIEGIENNMEISSNTTINLSLGFEPSNTTTKRPQMIVEPFTSLINFNYQTTPQLYIGYPPKGQY